MPIHAALTKESWFRGLPEPLQNLIVQRSVVQSYDKGAQIIREGAPARGLFALLEGRVHATKFTSDGHEILFHVGAPGNWFGEYACFTGRPSIGSVIAASRVRVLFLSRAAFERIVADEPRYFRCFADLTLWRCALLYRYVAEAQGLTPEQILLLRLRDLAHQWRDDRPPGPVEVMVTQNELASMIGVSRQTLSGFLAKLAARGAIEIGFRSIRVLPETGPGDRRAGRASR